MQESTTRKIYDLQSMVYDATFGRLVRRRVERAVNHMQITESDVVLDLGIGTGASLNYYPRRGKIIGVDLSSGMLRLARQRIRERQLDHVTKNQEEQGPGQKQLLEQTIKLTFR